MKRRTVFKHLAMASAAAWILPSCISDPKKVSIALNRLRITGDEEELIGDIAEVLIPRTDTPGARETRAHIFTLVMVDDCLSKPDQEKYLKGMRAFPDEVVKITARPFQGSPATEQLQILTAFEGKLESAGEETRMFYETTRNYIIQGYTSSQYFLTEVKPYQLVPGPAYDGCALISNDPKTLS